MRRYRPGWRMLVLVCLTRAWAPVSSLGMAAALLATSILLVVYIGDSVPGLVFAATSA